MSNLLDRSSLVLTPTAYNNGEALCIKPDDGSGDFQFSRNSAATRVNAQGLVENVQILSSNLVQNPSFSEEGVQEVSNGSFSQEGVELVTNGDFSSDTDWVLGTGWSISNEKLNAISVNSIFASQNVFSFVGKSFKVTYTISDYSQGEVALYIGGNDQTLNRSENGTFTEYVTVTSGNTFLYIYGTNNFTGSIDNVSVREVGQDWTLGTGWSIGEDKAVADGTTNNAISQTTISSVVGKSYKIDFTIDDYVTGNIRIYFGGVFTPFVNSNGVYSFYIAATAVDALATSASGLFNGSITNISVKEVGQDWEFGNGWSIADVNGSQVAVSDGTQSNSNLKYNNVFVLGERYKASFDVVLNSGTLNAFITNAVTKSISSSGSYTIEAVCDRTDLDFYLKSVNFDGYIDNVSIKLITDDTNLPRISYENFH